MIHYFFRSTVRPQHEDTIVGSGPVDEWADDEDEARRLAVAFERETFGMPRARVELQLVDVDRTPVDAWGSGDWQPLDMNGNPIEQNADGVVRGSE